MTRVQEEITSIAILFKKDEDTLNGIEALRREKCTNLDLFLRASKHIKELRNTLRELQEQLLHQLRFRKQKAGLQREVEFKLKNLKDLLDKIKKNVKDQLALLNHELITEENENILGDRIKKSVSDTGIREVVAIERKLVLDLLQNERTHQEILENQQKLIVEATQYFTSPSSISADAVHSIKNQNRRERRLIRQSRRLIRTLEKRHQRVQKEHRQLEATYGKSTLQGLPEEIIADIKKEYDKVKVVQSYFQKERSARNGLSPKTIIAVHLTNYLPESGILRTTGHALFRKEKIYLGRETIHFTFNGAVADLNPFAVLGRIVSWGDKSYAILIPAQKIWDRFVNILPVDAFIVGDLELPVGSELIVPATMKIFRERRLAYYQSKAGKARIIFREPHEKIKDTVKRRIRELGYSTMRFGQYDWIPDSEEAEAALKILSGWYKPPEGVATDFFQLAQFANQSLGLHSNTFWEQVEHWVSQYQDCLSVDGVVKRFVWMTERPSTFFYDLDQRSFERYKKGSILSAQKIKEEVTTFYITATDKEVKDAYQRMIIFFSGLIQFFESDLTINIIEEAKARKLME